MNSTDLFLIFFLLMICGAGWEISTCIFLLFFMGIFLFPSLRKKRLLVLSVFISLSLALLVCGILDPHIKESRFFRGKSSAVILWRGSIFSSGKETGICQILKGPYRGKKFLAQGVPGGERGTLEKAVLSFQPFDRPPFPSRWNEETVRESQGFSGKVTVIRRKLLKGPGPLQKFQNRVLKIMRAHFSLFPDPAGIFLQRVFLGSVEEDLPMKDIMKELGLLHLLAASGLHVSLIYILLLSLLSKTPLHRKGADFLIFTLLFFYAKLLNFPASICRAGLFLTFREIALLSHRKTSFRRIFLLSLAFFLFFRPCQAFSSGLLLSYACIMGIYVCGLIQKRQGFHMGFFKNIRMTLWISLFTLPILAAMNGSWNPIVLLANLFALPFFSFLFAAGLGIYLLSFLPFPIDLLMKTYGRIYQAFENLLKGLFLIRPPSIPLVFLKKYMGLYLFLLFLILLFRLGIWEKIKKTIEILPPLSQSQSRKRMGFFFRGFCLFLLIYFGLIFSPSRGPLFCALDVGQGDAFLLQYYGKNFLFDTGGKFDFQKKQDRDGEDFVLLLEDLGIDKVDAVFLSHQDYDHIGNLKALTDHLPVERIFLSPNGKGGLDPDIYRFITKDPSKRRKIALQPVKKDQSFLIQAGGIFPKRPLKIQVLNEGRFDAKDRNNHSMVLLLDYKARILLTGDLEEDQNWEENWPKKISLFKIAHHGSRKGTSLKILQKTRPKKALISSGRNNSYGHPSPETIKRLEKAGVPYDRTSELGTIYYRQQPGRPEFLLGKRKKTQDAENFQALLFSELCFFYWMARSPLPGTLIEVQGPSLAANRKNKTDAK